MIIFTSRAEISRCRRDGIINEEAYYEALVSGRVAGGALDVFAEEPPVNWKLLKLDNVIGSLHIGAEVAEMLVDFARKMQPP